MFVWVFSLVLFLLSPPPASPPAWIRGRRKEPPSIEVRLHPASPLCWWLDSGGLVTREGRSKDGREKAFDLFYLTVSNWIRELWGTGVKINSSWSALMVRLRAKSASEQGAHWHHVLVYFLSPFFPAEACISPFLCFISGSLWDGNGEGVQFFPLVYLSLGLLLFKCENAGNYLACEM